MRSVLPGGLGGGRLFLLFLVLAVLLWLATGFYRVNPGEQGINLVFGKYTGETEPGLNWNWPAPIGETLTPDVSTRYRVEVGFRSASDGSSGREVPEESLMLTGDENIIDVEFVVLWKIRDARQFLFGIKNPEEAVRNAVEAAVREIIGQSTFERTRTQGRGEVEIKSQELAQRILDSYGSGIGVEQVSMQRVDPPQEVIDAFRDVQAARADKERLVNEAQAYYNQITQEAEGQAAQSIKQAEAYKAEKVANAAGDAQRFLSIYEQYKNNKAVTERRLYLETMESIMRDVDKVLLDVPQGGALPYLSLNELMKNKAPQPAPAGASATGGN